MRLIDETEPQPTELTAMTTRDQRTPSVARIEGLLTEQRDLFKDLLREALQDVLEGEMTELLGAAARRAQ